MSRCRRVTKRRSPDVKDGKRSAIGDACRAEAYLSQAKTNGPLAYKDYYIVEVSPKLCPNPMGLGGIILVPNGQFKLFDQARANGILENILLREWQGKKGDTVRQSR